MATVKIRRGVVVPLAVFISVLVLLFVAGSKPQNMASHLRQMAGTGFYDPEMYDDEGAPSSEQLSQYLSGTGEKEKGGGKPASHAGAEIEEQLRLASKSGQEMPIISVPAKQYPEVPAPDKNSISGDLSFRFYSHNIKNGAHTNLGKGEMAWKHRRSHVVSSIKAHTPANTIITLQEPVKFQVDEVLEALNRYSSEEQPEWTAYGGGRIDGAHEGEFVPIIIRQAEWEVVFDDTFWLNPKDERSSYTGWDGKYPRICTHVTLRHRQTGTYINVFNTHFDHKGAVARAESAAMLMSKMDSINEWPSFLLGDFNAVPSDASYQTLVSVYSDTHTLVNSENRYGHHEWTVTGFSGEFAQDAKRIDYIFAPADTKREMDPVCEVENRVIDLRLKGYGLMHSKFGGVYMSDHRPLVADFQIHRC